MKLRTYIYKALLVCVVTSCSYMESPEASSEGYVDLKVKMDDSVEDMTVTKSALSDSEIAVQIVSTDGQTVFECSDITSVTEPIKLYTGDYTVYATSGADGGIAAFDSPFYTGWADVQIRANTISQAQIECTLAGVMTTVSFSQEIKDNFDYSLVISNGQGTLTYNSENENKEGYFSVTGTLEWTLNLKNRKGETFVVRDTYTDVQSRQHYAFNFSLESVPGGAFGVTEFKVILDNSLNETYHTPTIWINEDGPSIQGDDIHEAYVSDQLTDVAYNLHSTRSYSKILITHNDAGLLAHGLPYSTDLTSDDLTDFTTNSGIIVDIQEELDVLIDFTSFYNNLPIGEYSFKIFVENESGLSVEKNVQFIVKSCVSLTECDPWAKFIFVKGKWVSDSQPSQLKVQYKTSSDSQWIDFVPSVDAQLVVDDTQKTFKAYICGLTPSTDYQVRVITADEESATMSGTTETANQIYNLNFDDWYQNGKAWYPYLQDASNSPRVWDTANKGTTMAGDSNTVPCNSSGEFVSGKSAKMKTIWVSAMGITKLAAGTVYTGRYNSTIGTTGADLDWGVQFTSRPLALKGHYRYDAKAIDRTGDGYDSYKGQSDLCQIQVVLQDAGQTYFVVPTTYNGVSVNGPTLDRTNYVDLETHSSVIARVIRNFGDTNKAFQEITLPLIYRSLERIPTHAIVTFSSSYLGDYFTGGDGSLMWADEFEFIYDPLQLPAEDRDAFFNLFE